MDGTWFYEKDGQRHGPVDARALRSMFVSGELCAETLVSKNDTNDWKPAGQAEWFVAAHLPPAVTPPPSIGGDRGTGVFDAPVYEPSGPQTRPWVRYWARMVDTVLFSILFVYLLILSDPSTARMNDVLLGMIALFVYIFAEAVLLFSWGTTPGKALFKIRLRRADGDRLTFPEALGRSFRVWLKGEAIGFPIACLVTNAVAYRRLRREGRTSWDGKGSFTYSHQIVGPVRVVVATVLLLCFCVLVGMARI